MTKQALARVLWLAHQYEEMKANSEDKLLGVIQESFSALATSNPELALSVLKQINEQSGQIKEIISQREVDEESFVFEKASILPDTLEDEELQ